MAASACKQARAHASSGREASAFFAISSSCTENSRAFAWAPVGVLTGTIVDPDESMNEPWWAVGGFGLPLRCVFLSRCFGWPRAAADAMSCRFREPPGEP